MKTIQGGVCAAKGFTAGGIHCGIRYNRTKRDLALIVSEVPCAAAAVYTKNLVQGAPILVTKEHLKDHKAQAIICNSGNANTCNADGVEIAQEMCRLVSEATGIPEGDVVIASTGVIGEPLNIEPVAKGMPALVADLKPDCQNAAEAIMTTDTVMKHAAVSFEIGGVECHLGGIAKGSGMIHPNMATMLVFLTTDCAIAPDVLQEALSQDTENSFNMVSVDGDTSTNDMAVILANGLAGNVEIAGPGPELDTFKAALAEVTVALCRMLAGDGEGATKLLECKVRHAPTREIARKVAKTVVCSTLTKAAMFGADANWGRVLCAIGYSDVPVDIHKIDVSFRSVKGELPVCKDGAGVPFSEEKAKEILLRKEIEILIDLKDGEASATAWGCDLTYDYVKINGDYRT